jgi:hypothetical protein
MLIKEDNRKCQNSCGFILIHQINLFLFPKTVYFLCAGGLIITEEFILSV